MALTMCTADRCIGEVMISNRKGLHARASAKFVQCAERFDAEVNVSKGEERVIGTSIMGLMMLAAGPGTVLTVETEGPDAERALDAIIALIEGQFGEDE